MCCAVLTSWKLWIKQRHWRKKQQVKRRNSERFICYRRQIRSDMGVGKQILPKEIPSGPGESPKENKEMLEDENDKQVRTSTVGPLKKKELPRYEKEKLVPTYADIVSTGKLINEREK